MLLAASEGLDAQVCLRLVVNGRASPKRLPVARYDGNLDKGRENSEAVEIRLNESAIKALSQEERARLRLEARPLWNPKEPARLLRERPEGDWIFDLAGCASGVWLLTAWIGTLSPLRPLRVTINGTAPAELKLERAIHAHPQAARHKQLGELVRELATEASHAEWPRLMDFLATMSSLPSPTYEVVRRVAGDPEAAVLALIKDKMSGVLWAGLEQLPFMWALVPAQVWVRAVRRELAWREKKAAELASEGIPVDPRAFLKPLFKEAPLRASWMHCILSLWSETLGGKPSAPSPFVHLARTEAGRRFLRQQLQPAQQELIRAHAEDPWPEVDFQRPDWMGLYREVPRECWLEPTQLFQTAVLRAPVVAAVASARDLSLPPERVLELRRLRAFDERWFDEAYGSTLACLLGSALQKNPELFK
ncbi:hypothetical protein ACN28I_38120 [Archangium gephyra]|uniref:hypothetical protein n=1 Tax=Archangium gephyra TaxID=48 RepID=UPI003B7E17D2